MSNSNQTFRGKATLEAPKVQTIYNVSSPGTAFTEFSQALSDGTKQLLIRVRGTADLRYTFTATEANTKYVTIPKNNSRQISGVNLSSATIYLSCSKSSQVIEIEEWS